MLTFEYYITVEVQTDLISRLMIYNFFILVL